MGQPISETYVSVEISVGGCGLEHEAEVRYIHEKAMRGIFEKGGGQITPDEPENAEILSVKIGKHDIADLLTDEQIQAVITDVLEGR